ncbi:F-box protein CPR1-like [Cornus florida]|uniref:F-box protein CPR1-like n=1 Tax=Cornus florida TaxID=4283 RepID=UPI00289FD5A3|nr:F-box protein CPR1-like [Cornus florida]
MSDIPEDLIADVLSRLPVECLLRFSAIFSVAIDSLVDILKHDDDILPPAFHLHDLKLKSYGIIGSCNGLMCLYSLRSGTPILLNPSTKKYQLLPPVPKPSFRYSRFHEFYGFGYDPVNDDYKIVRIARYLDDQHFPFHNEVIVYSLRSNIWRVISCNFPPITVTQKPTFLSYGVLFNGALHWVATRQPGSRMDGFIIVAFDLVDENYREVQLPNTSGNHGMTLGVSGGCLFFSCIDGDDDDMVELWVMKDYMVHESWTKISIAFLSRVYMKKIWEVRILDYSNSSSEVLLTQINMTLCWLDLKEQKVVDVGIGSSAAEICIPSLVKLSSDLGTNVYKCCCGL